MSFDISITNTASEAIAMMGEISDRIIVESTRAAINRALVTGRTHVSKTLRERLNIKARDIKSKVALTKPTRGTLGNLNGNISFDDTPMPIMDFVRGNKSIIKQKGVKVKKRKKLKVEITKGKKFIMKGAFIQKVKTKNVFKRGNSGRFYKQGAPSLAHFISIRKNRETVVRKMMESFEKNLQSEVKFRMARAWSGRPKDRRQAF